MIYDLVRARQTLKEISRAYRATWTRDKENIRGSEFKYRGFSASYDLIIGVTWWIIGEVEERSIEKFLKRRDAEKSFGEAD